VKKPRPKVSLLHEKIPEHLRQLMHLTRLAEMGRLTASVAHEVNNPLTAILGCAENIELMLSQSQMDREVLRRHILEILKNAHRASDVIKRMGQMSRRENIHMDVIDIAELSLNAVEYMKNQMRELGAEFQFEFSRPIPVQCDSTQVEQIIINIVSNALHAVANNPSAKKIKISFESNEDLHMVKIWNNGPVIPKDVQAKLMAPFFTDKVNDEGTGLGLSISRTIMHAHNGELNFISNDKYGTEFVLEFPRLKNEPWQEQAERQLGAVVVIDHQANFRATIGEKFKMLGFEVVLAENVADSLVQMSKIPRPACVVFDIVPGSKESLAGLSALRQSLGGVPPIFTVSAYPSARDNPAELKSRGATECYQKPLRVEHFSTILELIHRAQKNAA
jgi:two-component sensor histidine kinase/CheY-like chemotaxis protein